MLIFLMIIFLFSPSNYCQLYIDSSSANEFQDGSNEYPFQNISFAINKSASSINNSMKISFVLSNSMPGYEMPDFFPKDYSIIISSASK